MKRFTRSFRPLFFLLIATWSTVPVYSRPDLSDPGLAPEERSAIIHRQEELWNLESRPQPQIRAGVHLAEALHRQDRTITGGESVRLSFGPLELSVPSRAFRMGARIQIGIVLLNTPSDFVFSPVTLEAVGRETPLLYESTGMFHLTMQDKEGRAVRPLQPLRVSLRGRSASQDVRVYRWNGSNWQERASSLTPPGESRQEAKSQEAPQPAPKSVPQSAPAGSQTGGSVAVANSPAAQPTPVETCRECEGMSQIYDRIDAGGWWNFDIPKPEFTCVAVRVDHSGEEYTVQAAGMNYQGISRGKRSGPLVLLNVLKKSEVMVFAVAKRGEKAWIGSLIVSETPSLTTHTSLPGPECALVGTMKMKPHPSAVLKKRESFLEAIGWI